MTENEKVTFGEILMTLGETFDRKLSKGVIDMYWMVLEPYNLNDFQRAVKIILNAKTFNKFPLPAEFIQYIDPPEDLELKAVNAFSELEDKITSRGIYYSVYFEDPIIHHVIRSQGGWIDMNNIIRGMDDTAYGWFKKDFCKEYVLFSKGPGTDRSPQPRMIGLFEKDNTHEGFLDGNKMLSMKNGEVVPANFIEYREGERELIEERVDDKRIKEITEKIGKPMEGEDGSKGN